jgi:hypothetical protein
MCASTLSAHGFKMTVRRPTRRAMFTYGQTYQLFKFIECWALDLMMVEHYLFVLR